MSQCGGMDASSSSPSSSSSSSSSLLRRSESEKVAGYGQPADLWSTGCLLYTMIVGRNPFALPATTPASGGSGHRDRGMTTKVTTATTEEEEEEEEETRRIRRIIDRVVRGDWSVPAGVRMTDGSMESLLVQLLEMQPRKRGTARGILNLHPFFRTKSATSMGPSTIGTVGHKNNIALKEETGTIGRNGVGTAEQTIADSMSSASLPTKVMAIETNRMHLLSSRGTYASEDPQKTASYTSWMDDLSPTSSLVEKVNEKNKQEKEVVYRNVYDSQRTTTSQKYKHAASEERDQGRSIISTWSFASSVDVLKDKNFASDPNQAREQSIIEPVDDQDVIDEKKPKTRLFISMKSLHRLPHRKYSWEEPRRGTSSSKLTVFFLGNDGLVIQRESRNNPGLWMHVTSDGLGILWGNLQPQPRRSTQRDVNKGSSLWLEAYSRAPEEFSKMSLISLLSLKCYDIISLYETLERVVQRVKLQTPMITVHLYTTNKSSFSTPEEPYSTDFIAKTMLMGNEPFPDVKTLFADGTIIQLSSADGSITVEGDHGTSQLEINQERFFSSLRADRSPPPSCSGMITGVLRPSPKFVDNLCLFIESARECLLLEDRFNLLLGGHAGVSPVRPLAQAHVGPRETNHDLYPVVRKIVMHGWRREHWVVEDNLFKSDQC